MFVKRKDGNFGRTTISPVMPIVENENQDESRRRGPEDIKADLLITTIEPKTKTKIMSLCNLSSSQMEKYIRELLKKSFLEIKENNGKSYIQITRRGKKWLEKRQELKAIENGADLGDTTYVA